MYFNIVFNEFRFHGLFISLSTFNWHHSPKSLSSAETDLVESTTVQQLWACQRPYAMLKAPVPSITVVKQH
jgi:hypothetical protein